MKLDRNITTPRRGKYALIKLRDVTGMQSDPNLGGGFTVFPRQAVDFGDTPESDFFVIRLKDRFAGPALRAYASAITEFLVTMPADDKQRVELTEYHHEIIALAEAACRHQNKRTPD